MIPKINKKYRFEVVEESWIKGVTENHNNHLQILKKLNFEEDKRITKKIFYYRIRKLKKVKPRNYSKLGKNLCKFLTGRLIKLIKSFLVLFVLFGRL
jgi:hypothetical protein